MPTARTLRAWLQRAAGGDGDALLARLGPFGSFAALTALWEAGWLGAAQRSPRITEARIRQRLREIGDARRTIAEAALLPAGATVLLEGAVTALSPLALDDGSGERASVPAAPARWIGAAGPPIEGDRVTLLGFADPTVDLTQAPPGPRRTPRALLVRAAGLPLVAHLAPASPRGPWQTREQQDTLNV
jgi:hypothetical protein